MGESVKIALAGNPNTGKSTVFNALTGLKQHTGNWSGKTVTYAVGHFSLGAQMVELYDLPGIYSLFSDRAEECEAKEFICFEQPDVTIVILDATSLARNLPLGLQIMEMTDRVVFCLNLQDEALKKGIHIDCEKLESLIGVPVVPMAARQGQGLDVLKKKIGEIVEGSVGFKAIKTDFFALYPETYGYLEDTCAHLLPRDMTPSFFYSFLIEGEACLLQKLEERQQWDMITAVEISLRREMAVKILQQEGSNVVEFCEKRSLAFLRRGAEIADAVITTDKKKGKGHESTARIDRILLAKATGIPLMLLLLGLVFWITVAGANVPSDLLMKGFQNWGVTLSSGLLALGAPSWLHGLLMEGVYLTVSWVVSVMLPPMAIFFPLFTLLEDFGVLPRIAFNLDGLFQKAGAHGKQSLSMCMVYLILYHIRH